jgi:hypothetical protein
MTQLVIIVVAAVWAAVVIPPLLRSRVENRPNSSVTDFRRQLSTLQSTSTPRMRTIGRPLAQSSPLHRPAAAGRPGQAHHRQASVHSNTPTNGRQRTPAITSRSAGEGHPAAPVYRSHGDPSGGFERPHRQTHMDRRQAHPERGGRPQHQERTDRRHGAPSAKGPRAAHAADARADVRRRRGNVLFLLVVLTACTLFLAMVTSATVLLYVFTLLFLATCGYVYQLTQVRRRERSGWNDGWFEQQR